MAACSANPATAVSTSPTSPSPLPDVAHDAAALARPLDWVGMERIALPVRIAGEDGAAVQVAASVDVAVDLRDADARGIHMSRLYLQLQEAFATRNHHPGRTAARAAGLRRIAAGPVDQRAAGAALRPPAAARGAGQRASRLEALSGGDRGDAARRPPAARADAGGRIFEHLPGVGGVVAAAQCRTFRRGFRRARGRCRTTSSATGWPPSAAWPPRRTRSAAAPTCGSNCGRRSTNCRSRH